MKIVPPAVDMQPKTPTESTGTPTTSMVKPVLFAPEPHQQNAASDNKKVHHSGSNRKYRHVRIDWCDISRALAVVTIILFMTCGLYTSLSPEHVPPTLDASVIANAALAPSNPASNFAALIGSFAYPLLFACIGYTMRRQKTSLAWIEDVIGKYLIPYVVFGFLTAIVYCVMSSERDMFGYLAALVYGNGDLRGDFVLGSPFAKMSLPVLWILMTLMVAQVMTFFLSKLPLITRILVAGIVFFAGSSTAGHVFLPFDIQPAMCAAWFMTCGMIMREQHAFTSRGWEKVLLAVSLTVGVLYAVLVSLGFLTVPDYAGANYRNGIMDMLGGVCIAAVVMLVAQVIALVGGFIKRAFCWVGENFLAVLSCFAPVFCLLFNLESVLGVLANVVGVEASIAITFAAALVLSIGLAAGVSHIPYIRGMFAHYAVGAGYKTKTKKQDLK